MTWILHLARRSLPPIILLATLLLVWQAATAAWNVPAYLLPGPWSIVQVVAENPGKLVSATWVTAQGAVCGFAASLLVGVVVAFAFSQSRMIRSSCYPYAIFLQTVPIIAVAPLIINWFGTGFQSVVIVAFIISLFPIVTNTTAGMLAVDSQWLDLFQLHNAGRWQIVVKLRLPNAVPHLMTGARTSSGLAVIGSIVGEFFAGYGTDRFGLGYLILMTSSHLKTAELFAAVMASTLLGLVIFGTVSAVGAAVLKRWYD